MTFLFRRVTTLKSFANRRVLLWARSMFSSGVSAKTFDEENEANNLPSVGNKKRDSFVNYSNRLHLSPLFSGYNKGHMEECKIELVDNETWQVSSGLAEAWKGNAELGMEAKSLFSEEEDNSNVVVNYMPPNKEDQDFDEIEDMRIRGNLFYKLDKSSKEYEEYKFDFHRMKSWKNQDDKKENSKKKEKHDKVVASKIQRDSKIKDDRKEIKKEKLSSNSGTAVTGFHGDNTVEHVISRLNEMGGNFTGNKMRTPTFNQLTAPYHEPFCLDIYVSKGSVRASIIHRATSKVVAVAHSISKDIKFELGSTKSRSACAAVGEVLARRALADDIHNVVYTPRKGEKLEGKLQIVLQSIIDHGIDVKVKIKQRKVKKR